MGKKRGRKKKGAAEREDPMRQVVQGVLSLILGALATWLAAKLTDLILGPAKDVDLEEAE